MFNKIKFLLDHPEHCNDLKKGYEDALSALNEYLSTSPHDKTALELKVTIVLKVQRFNLAKQVAKTLLTVYGEEIQYLYWYGFSSLSAGDFDIAEATLKRAHSLDPDSSYRFGKMALQARDLGRLKKQGNDYVSQRKTDEAIAMYSKGIEKCASEKLFCGYIFLNNRAACYINQKRFAEALQDLDVSLEQFPYAPKTYLRLIKCISKLNVKSRFDNIPEYYINALLTGRYTDPATKNTKRDYITWIREHDTYKTIVHEFVSKAKLDNVLTLNPHVLTVVDIYASWCEPCKKLAPLLNDMYITHPTALFISIDGEKIPEVSRFYGVEGYPTVLIIRNKQIIKKIVGFAPEEIESTIESNLNLEADTIL